MKNIYKITLSIVAISVIASPVLAQGSPPATPIDGGLSLLLAGAAAYGAKKLYDHKK